MDLLTFSADLEAQADQLVSWGEIFFSIFLNFFLLIVSFFSLIFYCVIDVCVCV